MVNIILHVTLHSIEDNKIPVYKVYPYKSVSAICVCVRVCVCVCVCVCACVCLQYWFLYRISIDLELSSSHEVMPPEDMTLGNKVTGMHTCSTHYTHHRPCAVLHIHTYVHTAYMKIFVVANNGTYQLIVYVQLLCMYVDQIVYYTLLYIWSKLF